MLRLLLVSSDVIAERVFDGFRVSCKTSVSISSGMGQVNGGLR